MKTIQHTNLFLTEGKSSVYARFQTDFNSTSWHQEIWKLVLLGCAAGAALVSSHPDWLWLFGGLLAVERAVSRYTDNSNRNWAMHVIDWIESEREIGASNLPQ